MSRYEHGRILAVNETKLGSELVAAHAAGVLSLTVEDPVDFDEDGGHLLVADQVIEYETYDDDTGEITLLSALEAAAGDGERVWLYDPLYQTITTDLIAEVELDGDDDNTDALECSIAHHLVDKVSEGIRGLRGESVRLEQDGDEWIIVDILGLSDKGATGTQFWQDAHTVTAAGAQSIALTHEAITNSEHLYWNGLYQPAGEWTRNGQTIAVPDSGGHLVVGDELVVEYAYHVGIAQPAELLGVTSASGTETGQSVTVPVPEASGAGNLLILAAGRWPTSDPPGWTRVATRESAGLSGALTVWTRVSDGTETSVTVSLSEPHDYFSVGAICLAYRRGSVASSTTDNLEPSAADATFAPTPAGGSLNLAIAYLDGSDTDQATTVAGEEIVNYNPAPVWALVAATGDAPAFQSTSGRNDRAWIGITLGLE